MNIAVCGRGLVNWGGGVDLLRYCITSLAVKAGGRPLKIFVLMPEISILEKTKNAVRPLKNKIKTLLGLGKYVRFREPPADVRGMAAAFKEIDRAIEVVFYRDTDEGLVSCLNGIQADAVLPLMRTLGKTFPIPWVGYIFDFQHKYHPEFFSPAEIGDRDVFFKATLNDARSVVVTSKTAGDDVDKFFPDHSGRVFALPFAPFPVKEWFGDDWAVLAATYNLPGEYFLISNQFWVHKSHVTAFEALARLKASTAAKEFKNVHIVCTGKTHDYRFPDHFENLKKRIEELGLSDSVHFLGHIPKKDQIGIMRRAKAVLQPTLFEGLPGGLSVNDAVALGVSAIVSDIPVNLEIKEKGVYFFQAGSADDMADKMVMALNSNAVAPPKDVLLQKGRERIGAFGDSLLAAVDYAVKMHGK